MIALDLFDLPDIRRRVDAGTATNDDCGRLLGCLDRMLPRLRGRETAIAALPIWDQLPAALGEDAPDDKSDELDEAIDEARQAASELESAAASLRRMAHRPRSAA